MEEFPYNSLEEIISFLVGALIGWITKHFNTKKPIDNEKR